LSFIGQTPLKKYSTIQTKEFVLLYQIFLLVIHINSLAEVHRNTVTLIGQGSGVYSSNSSNSSNLIAYGSGNNKGRNKIVANAVDGIYSLSSSPIFGKDIVNQYGNNQIQDNGGYQAVQSSAGQLRAERCYWAGQQNDISGNVDNVPYLSTAPNPVGWGQSDTYDPSLFMRKEDDFVLGDSLIFARMSNEMLAQSGTLSKGFDPVEWAAKFAAAMATGLEKGDWADAAEVITELWRELQDGRVPLLDYTLLAAYVDDAAVESTIRKYLALTLVEKSLAEQDISQALADLVKYQTSNSTEAAELLANAGIIYLFRKNDLAAAQNVLTQLQAMAQSGDINAARQADSFGKIIDDYQQRNTSVTNLSRPVAEPAASIIPATSRLAQNYPNPFNPATIIRFSLQDNQKVRLRIFDLNGKLTRILVDGELPAGEHTISWDGRNQSGGSVASGIYFYEIMVSDKIERKKMTLIR
jgi:hypothetical protein